MESITIKVEEDFAVEIEKAMRPMYTTKTEFIREAIRDKIASLRDQKLRQYLGSAKTKTSSAQEERLRKKAGQVFKSKFYLK